MTSVVSMIPYANMAPYWRLPKPKSISFERFVPSASVAALQTGAVVAAAVPVGALPLLGNTVEPLGAYGIAARTEVGSVMLFSKLPLTSVRRPERIVLTSQSATSIRLLYLILGYTNGFDAIPCVTDEEDDAVATLLIGDDALRRLYARTDPHIIDLVTEWYRHHQKPFVFARWVVRRDAPPGVKATLLAWLNGLPGNDDAYVLESAGAEAARIGITRDEMVAYLRGMTRVLGPDELEGQAIFLNELERRVPAGLFQTATSVRITKSPEPPFQRGVSGPNGPHRETKARIEERECLKLLSTVPLGDVMRMAHQARLARHPDGVVTYVRDTNPNYTNICTTKCRFCAFCRDKTDEDAYTLTPEALVEKVRAAERAGAKTVLLQGGHNPGVRLSDWLAYINAVRNACPGVHLHPFSPPEILFMAKQEKMSPREVLSAIKEAGVDTMPGGGAEILSNDIRKLTAPKKCSADAWLDVMVTAHELGFRTTATMMFGHAESDAHIAEHLFRLRAVQDETGGFSSFIPWSFKPGRSPLSDEIRKSAHPARYVRIIAVARLVLDNFDHIQSSWFSESERAGMLGLLAGADDFGGILVEENVLKTSGYERRTTEGRVRDLIHKAGFAPAVRDAHYNIIEPPPSRGAS